MSDDIDLILAEVPKGWHSLARKLFVELRRLPGWSVDDVVQAKEKFGTLRVYLAYNENMTTNSVNSAESLVKMAENLSAQTCQKCGSMDSVSTKARNGWIMTMCERCWDE